MRKWLCCAFLFSFAIVAQAQKPRKLDGRDLPPGPNVLTACHATHLRHRAPTDYDPRRWAGGGRGALKRREITLKRRPRRQPDGAFLLSALRLPRTRWRKPWLLMQRIPARPPPG